MSGRAQEGDAWTWSHEDEVSHLWRVAKGPPAESGMWWLRRAGQACGQMRVVTSWPDVFPPTTLAQGIKPPRTQQPKNGETEARARDGRS